MVSNISAEDTGEGKRNPARKTWSCTQGNTVMQLMQIVGDRNVRIVPDVAVSGANGSTGLLDGLLGVMLRSQAGSAPAKQD